MGLVSGEAILGANIFKDLFAGIRDIIGGRSASYEKELKKAKDIATQEMVQQARQGVAHRRLRRVRARDRGDVQSRSRQDPERKREAFPYGSRGHRGARVAGCLTSGGQAILKRHASGVPFFLN